LILILGAIKPAAHGQTKRAQSPVCPARLSFRLIISPTVSRCLTALLLPALPFLCLFFAFSLPFLCPQVLGVADMRNILRLQLAELAPGGEIKQHLDMGGYSKEGHRIHLVVQTNPGGVAAAALCVMRDACCTSSA